MSTHPPVRSSHGPAGSRRQLFLAAAGIGLGSVCPLAAAQNLRVAAYNIEADINGVTAPRTGLYTVLEAIGQQSFNNVARPIDILALEETTSNAATVAPIVTALNGSYGAGTYALAGYQGTQRGTATNGNGPNALIYNATTLSLLLQNGASGVGFAPAASHTFSKTGAPPALQIRSFCGGPDGTGTPWKTRHEKTRWSFRPAGFRGESVTAPIRGFDRRTPLSLKSVV